MVGFWFVKGLLRGCLGSFRLFSVGLGFVWSYLGMVSGLFRVGSGFV